MTYRRSIEPYHRSSWRKRSGSKSRAVHAQIVCSSDTTENARLRARSFDATAESSGTATGAALAEIFSRSSPTSAGSMLVATLPPLLASRQSSWELGSTTTPIVKLDRARHHGQPPPLAALWILRAN